MPNWTNGTVFHDFYVEYIIYGLLCFLASQQVFREILQLSGETKFIDYFKELSNFFDMLSMVANVGTLVMRRQQDVDLHKVRLMASVALIALYSQLFYWLRIHDKLAQYVDLIINTFTSIGYFIGVLIIFLFMFFSGFYMI